MFRPDETAYDLFKRMRRESAVELQLSSGRTERLETGEIIELNLTSAARYVPFLCHLCTRLRDGYSSTRILLASMRKVPQLTDFVEQTRVYHVSDLGSLFDSITASTSASSIVLILDRLASILNVQRDASGHMLANNGVVDVLNKLQAMVHCQRIIVLWLGEVLRSHTLDVITALSLSSKTA